MTRSAFICHSEKAYVVHGESAPGEIMMMDDKNNLCTWLPSNMSLSLHYEKAAQRAFAVLQMIWCTFSPIISTDFQLLSAQRRGDPIETHKRWSAGQNKQRTIDKNTAKLEQETENLHNDLVDMDVGKLIMQARQDKGLTQKELATRINEKPQVISDYEQGRAVKNQLILSKIEKALGVKLRGKDKGQPLGEKSLRKDRELWWTSKAREMEKAFATGNSRVLYQLIRSTGPRKATVSETISEKDGSLIHSQKRRLERWAEHFEEHKTARDQTNFQISGKKESSSSLLIPIRNTELQQKVAQWLTCITDQHVCGSSPTFTSRPFLSRPEQPGNIPALVIFSGGICHAIRRKHKSWDTARLLMPRQGKPRWRGRVRTRDPPPKKVVLSLWLRKKSFRCSSFLVPSCRATRRKHEDCQVAQAQIKSFSCITLSVPKCHATGRKHQGWDTLRSPKRRQRSRGKGRV
ncbi:hypothetical protein T265_02682 [Opisthorchis viverrini]|uniref:HTH cro/C1-type domain-containing protein n=1 Tax=Opisthorchis viverrini TaxID=6198 RepID=A0A075AI47_OPIVI|nr:hypothetical protein T265_02682 [Opisthorchis viverrini]KER31004.1 hypothetical protein T265_02682 [Opisthorchis viverrini]